MPPKPALVPRLRGEGRLATHMSHFLYFCLKHPHSSVPQIPLDEPSDAAHQPPGTSDGASPLRPPGAKELRQISLTNHIESATSPPLPINPCPPAILPAHSPPKHLPLHSQEIRSPKGSQCKTQICRSWFLAQVQTTFVPEICFRALFSKHACAQACAKQHRSRRSLAPRLLVPTRGQVGALGAPEHRPQPTPTQPRSVN